MNEVTNKLEIYKLYIDEIEVFYSIIHSKKRKKTVTIKIKDINSIIVLAPVRAGLKNLHNFVNQEKNWIKKKLFDLREKDEKVNKLKFIDGEKIPYLGESYPLRIFETQISRAGCKILNNEMIVETGFYSVQKTTLCKHVSHLLLFWYKQEARNWINKRMNFWCSQLNLFPKSWQLTNATSRWGSCSINNIIRINWRLIFASLFEIDYIIVHELCHIIHKNHSNDFWTLLSSILPDFKERKKNLRNEESRYLTLL